MSDTAKYRFAPCLQTREGLDDLTAVLRSYTARWKQLRFQTGCLRKPALNVLIELVFRRWPLATIKKAARGCCWPQCKQTEVVDTRCYFWRWHTRRGCGPASGNSSGTLAFSKEEGCVIPLNGRSGTFHITLGIFPISCPGLTGMAKRDARREGEKLPILLFSTSFGLLVRAAAICHLSTL